MKIYFRIHTAVNQSLPTSKSPIIFIIHSFLMFPPFHPRPTNLLIPLIFHQLSFCSNQYFSEFQSRQDDSTTSARLLDATRFLEQFTPVLSSSSDNTQERLMEGIARWFLLYFCSVEHSFVLPNFQFKRSLNVISSTTLCVNIECTVYII